MAAPDDGMNRAQAEVLMDIAREAGRNAMAVLQQQLAAGWPSAPTIAMNLESMWLMGLCVGLKVGIADVASARRLDAMGTTDRHRAAGIAGLPEIITEASELKMLADVDALLHLVERL